MSFSKKVGMDLNTEGIVQKGTDAAKDTAKQCAQQGQKIAEEAIDKGCQAAKEVGEKTSAQVKCGFKKK